jgi:sec-independent protein translocase protein TatA
MGPVGGPEMAFIFFLALLLFGPKKLPELGRTVAKGLVEFKRLKSEWKETFDREAAQLGQGTEELTRLANQYRAEFAAADWSSSPSHYESSYGSERYVPFAGSTGGDVEAKLPALLPEGVTAQGAPVAAES